MDKRMWVCLLLLLLVSCNFRPSYERPEINLGDGWRFSPENGGEYANLAWWKQFGDPALDALILKALDNNQNLQVASARVLEFYAKYRATFAELFPDIGADGGIDRIKLPKAVDFFPVPPTIPRVNSLYHLFLKLSYEVDFWGKLRNQADAAKADYQGLIESRRTVIVSLISSLAMAYVQLKQFDNQLNIAKLTYESRLYSEKIARLRFEGGLVSEMEVMQAQSEADSAAVEVKNFERLVPLQEDLISVLIGEAPGPIPRGTLLTDLKLPPSIPAGLPSDLLENRPDILQAEQKILAANAQVGVARAAFFPAITLTGWTGDLTTSIREFFQGAAGFFDYSARAAQPLFTGGKLIYQSKEASALLEEAIHSYQQTILTALQEVEDALISHQKAKEKLAIRKSQLASLEEYRKLATLRYDNGQNDYLTVLDAEKSLFIVWLAEAEAEGEVFLTLINLYKALGQGWKVADAAKE